MRDNETSDKETHMARSILAVVTGFLLIGFLSFGMTAVLKIVAPETFGAARLESVPALLLVTFYVMVFAVAGCYLAALMAPHSPMKHALVLGVLGLIFNVVGIAARWEAAPAWFNILSLLLVMPYAWMGGRLREMQLRQARGVTIAGDHN
jgi:hypothetical protein